MNILDEFDPIERPRRFNENSDRSEIEVIDVEESCSFRAEKNDFVRNWILNTKRIHDYKLNDAANNNQLNKSTQLLKAQQRQDNKGVNLSKNQISVSTTTTVSSSLLSTDVSYKMPLLKLKPKQYANNSDYDEDEDDVDDDDITRVTKDLIQNIKLNHDFDDDFYTSNDSIELGRRFTCSTPKPAINLEQLFSFIEVEVSSMNDDEMSIMDAGCLDIEFEPLELNVLKEIESFNENKSVDFNFKLKIPTTSLNQKKLKQKPKDLLKNLLLKNQIKSFPGPNHERKRRRLTNDTNRVRGFNILKEFLIRKYQIHH